MNARTLFPLIVLTMAAHAQQIKLPGSKQDIKVTANSADAFCIALLENSGTPDVGAPGSTYYSNAVLKVRRNLRRGEFESHSCAYSVQTLPEDSKETAPAIGKPFLALGSIVGGTFRIAKIAEPSAENVAIVEQVLRERGLELNSEIKQTSPEEPDQQGNHQDENPSPSVQPPAPKKATEAKPTSAPSEEPSSSTPWSIIVVLIVAALGLLWLVLKRRS